MFWKIALREQFGGEGSGNFGHAGRPGEVGGSGEGAAISDYTSFGFKEINPTLRGGGDLGSHAETVKVLDKIINEAPPLKHRKLYRGIAKSPSELGMKEGEIYTDPSFVSTTKDAKYMYNNLWKLKTRIVINLPKESKGLDVSRTSYKKAEHEVILPRGSSFHVDSIQHDEFGYDNVRMTLLQK